jgi:hypothetical protein
MRFSFPINLNIVPNVLDSEDEFFVGKQKNAPALRLKHRQYKFAEEGKKDGFIPYLRESNRQVFCTKAHCFAEACGTDSARFRDFLRPDSAAV